MKNLKNNTPDDSEIVEILATAILAIIMALVIVLGVGPLGLYFVFKPFAIVLTYWNKVSISFGLIILSPMIKMAMGID